MFSLKAYAASPMESVFQREWVWFPLNFFLQTRILLPASVAVFVVIVASRRTNVGGIGAIAGLLLLPSPRSSYFPRESGRRYRRNERGTGAFHGREARKARAK